MHIFQHIAENLSLLELEGYGAIEFYRAGQWFVGACNYGDLEVAKLKNGRGIVWASTKDAIHTAVFQAGYEIETFYKVEQGRLYRIDAEEMWETGQDFSMRLHYIPPTKTLTGSYSPLTAWEKDLNTASVRNWDWDGDEEKDKDTLPFGENIISECEFCNERGSLLDYQGSLICRSCQEVLQ
jgi:hypothetical protein